MEIIGKISKGSKMDQVYLPKNRIGLFNGQYVKIIPLEEEFKKKEEFRPIFYNARDIEPFKLKIIEEIFNMAEYLNPENILITGSFLERGSKFNDIDILIIKEKEVRTKELKEKIEGEIGIKAHIILISQNSLNMGISTDPLYNLMISKCVSKKRLIFKEKRVIDYKILDYQLLKSKNLIDNFDLINGEEKYYLTLNMISILLFIEDKRLSKKIVEEKMFKLLGIKAEDIKQNLIEKEKFIRKYKEFYNKTFNLLMDKIR